jgi:hypothetical protein
MTSTPGAITWVEMRPSHAMVRRELRADPTLRPV